MEQTMDVDIQTDVKQKTTKQKASPPPLSEPTAEKRKIDDMADSSSEFKIKNAVVSEETEQMIDVNMEQQTVDLMEKTTQKAGPPSPLEPTAKKQKFDMAEEFPDLYPNLYLQVLASNGGSYWYSLDLVRGKSRLMNWKSEPYLDAVAISVESKIYLLGGYLLESVFGELEGAHGIGNFLSFDALDAYSESFVHDPIPTAPSGRWNCTGVKDIILVFQSPDRRLYDIMDGFGFGIMDRFPLSVYDTGMGNWFRWTEEHMILPDVLIGIDPDMPVLSDSERVYAHYPSKGLYAFDPKSREWNLLTRKEIDWSLEFTNSAVCNDILYGCKISGDIRKVLSAFDLEDHLRPLKMVWPRLNHNSYRFGKDVEWMSPIDLGNGWICLLNQTTIDVNLLDGYFSESDSEHFYSSGSEDDVPLSDEYILVLRGMMLNVEKVEGSRGKMKVVVKKAIRVSYEFGNILSSDARVQNIVTIERPNPEAPAIDTPMLL